MMLGNRGKREGVWCRVGVLPKDANLQREVTNYEKR